MAGRNVWWAVCSIAILTLAGCGVAQKSAAPEKTIPTLAVHEANLDRLSALPLAAAQTLGFFQHDHLRVEWTPKSQATVFIGQAGGTWPIVGYVMTRPDMVLMSPVADPQFRLRALNHLTMVASMRALQERPLAEKILAQHRAHISTWSGKSFQTIEMLWQRHHLPWVLVTLQQAEQLWTLDPHSVVLSWFGASTGPIPQLVITARQSNAKVARFLNALNLALWYLHTTPPTEAASALGDATTGAHGARLLRDALHYQYWPATTFPDSSSYNRARALWTPTWPAYQHGVDPQPARQALSMMDPGP